MNATAQQPAAADPFAWLFGSFNDDRDINQRLEWAAKYCNLISPASTCRLPPGCSVAFNLVKIDANTETHDVGFGKRSLLRTALLKLANAAGICWDPRGSGRVDPGTNPHYVHWHASGAWRSLDGTVLTVPGDLQMDLRDGSQQCVKILESASNPEKGRVQLRDTRAKILEHAQSKAELRAVRKALAIRSYTADELQKPFVIARLVFDGRDEDPEMERENKRAVRAQMLGGTRALFGPPPMPEHRAPALPAAQTIYALPQVGEVSADFDSSPELEGEPVTRTNGWSAQPPPPAPPVATSTPVTQATAQQAPPGQPPSAMAPPPPSPPGATPPAPPPPPPGPGAPPATGQRTGVCIPGGRNKGTPIEDAADEDLEYWANRKRKELPNTDPRFREKNTQELAAFDAEIKRRAGDSEPMPKGW